MLPPGRRPRIGLLGGSFNPAHDGHRYISRRARILLDLDVVWWLVSPQNPLKPEAGMAPLEARLKRARACAGAGGAIRVTAIERALGTRFTVDTVCALSRRLPQARLVWLMGADNLIQMPSWHRWPALFAALPIAIFDRPTYSLRALLCPAARRFARYRRRLRDPARLVDCTPPAWAWIGGGLHPASATRIRECGGWGGAQSPAGEERSER